jgi:peptidoglycan/xylan/chitin deacetylase (PgdA/CDA1 family)
VRLADAGVRDPLTKRLFALLHRAHYWLGVAAHGGPHDGDRVRVLCWHAIADLAHDPQLQAYGVPPRTFDDQLSTLRDAGYVPVTPEEVLAQLERGAPVPRRSVLITFDDCYTDLATAAAPTVARHQAPAVAFAVTQRVGDRNRWDDHLGVTALELADWPALKSLHEQGWAVGGHSRTHPLLTRASDTALREELDGARADIEEQGLPAPTLLAYPYGEQDARVRAAAREAGYRVAFTVTPGVARRGRDLHAVPRIEIHPQDRGWRLRLKMRLAGRPAVLWLPAPQRRAHLSGAVKDRLRPLRNRLRGRRGR